MNVKQYHPAAAKIIRLLETNNLWFETFEHEPVRTSEEAAELRDGYTLHQGAKAIIIRVKQTGGKKFFAMVVLPGDRRFNSKKVEAYFQAKDVRFATVEEVAEVTQGILPGGVPPFGSLFGLEVIVDDTLLGNEKIIFNAGDRSFSIGMFCADYIQLLQPNVVQVV